MSGVHSTGFFAILKNPLAKEDREELNENLYDNGSGLALNYEGTLVYSQSDDMYGLTIMKKASSDDFLKVLKEHNFEIEEDSVRQYSSMSESLYQMHMFMLKISEYREKM